MIEALAVVVLTFACSGAGALLLHALGLWRERAALERFMLAFAVGFGLVGWLFFWVGISGLFGPGVTWAVCLALAAGNALNLTVAAEARPAEGAGPVFWALLGLLAVALAFDFAEALAPPADGDTLSYHFTLPQRFAEEGAVFFVPRVFEGAIPLLVHMTYTAAHVLGLSGQTGGVASLTGWAFVSGWMASGLLFSFSLRWLPLAWALALAVLFQTLPAMVYGAGAGHVEPRLALFVMIAVIGLADCRRSPSIAPAVLAGLGAGFYIATKYTGLLFAFAAGVALLTAGRPRFKRAALFSLAAAAAGIQWYGWNFIHTGDPVFPFLFKLADSFGLANPAYWNAEFDADFNDYIANRGDPSRTFHWWFSYPVIATLFPTAKMEAGRVGLGPYFLLVAPAAAIALWHARRRLWDSPLLPVAVLVFGQYLMWMKFGVIPKVRHVLPVIPPLLLCLTVAATSQTVRWARRPMALAVMLSLAVNFAAHGLFSREYLKHVLSGESREAFLTRNVFAYPIVPAINALTDATGVFIWSRQLQFYIRPRVFFAAPLMQVMIDTRYGRMVPETFLEQLKRQGISHLALNREDGVPEPGSLMESVRTLRDGGCLALVESVDFERFSSRSLKSLSKQSATAEIWRIDYGCGVPSGGG